MSDHWPVLFIGGPYDGRLLHMDTVPLPSFRVAVYRRVEPKDEDPKNDEFGGIEIATYLCHSYQEGEHRFYVYTDEKLHMSYADVMRELILNYTVKRAA
jgi:hypothetical protein